MFGENTLPVTLRYAFLLHGVSDGKPGEHFLNGVGNCGTAARNIERSLSRHSARADKFATGREWVDLLRDACGSWLADRAPSMGAAIAYYTIFSLAPILILIIAVAGLAFGRQAAEGALFDQIAAFVGKESAGAVQALLRSASGTASGIIATLVGLFALILAATGVFGEVQAALNVIWKTKPATWNASAALHANLRADCAFPN